MRWILVKEKKILGCFCWKKKQNNEETKKKTCNKKKTQQKTKLEPKR